MKEEETMVDVDIADGCASLAISRHIRQFIILAECLAIACGANAACDIILLSNNIVPDSVYSLDISGITCEAATSAIPAYM